MDHMDHMENNDKLQWDALQEELTFLQFDICHNVEVLMESSWESNTIKVRLKALMTQRTELLHKMEKMKTH